MKNRHLPILHKQTFPPCSLWLERVPFIGDEWVVKIVLENANFLMMWLIVNEGSWNRYGNLLL
jgi:hypothetical protein